MRVPLRSGPQSRMTVLGNLALWVAFLVGIWGALTGFMGGLLGRADLQQSARHAVFAMCAALLTAVFALEWALFHHDFNVEYVAAYTSRNLPIFYTWSALYAGQKGSLLFWASVLSVFGSLALTFTSRRHAPLLPYVAGVVCAVAAFFVTVIDRKSTRLNSSHANISYAVFCLKKKKRRVTLTKQPPESAHS